MKQQLSSYSDPYLIEPVLEILINSVTRLNVVEINKSEK